MRGCLPASLCFGVGTGRQARPDQAEGEAQAQSGAAESATAAAVEQELTPRRRASAAGAALLQEKYSELHKLNSVYLEADLYTNAFVSSLSPPRQESTDTAGYFAEVLELTVAVFAMCLVPFVQLLMAWAVHLHVENNLVHGHSYPLYTAYEMFVGSNITLPLHTVEALCGWWEDQEMQDFAQGPLRHVNMPDGTAYGPDGRYSLFYNLKQPTRTWDYARLGDERSVLDDVMYVISEGVTLNPATPSGYSLLFIMILAMFLFSIGKEFRSICRWLLMLSNLDIVESRRGRRKSLGHMISQARMASEHMERDSELHQEHVNGQVSIWQFNPDTGKFSINGITGAGRIVGLISFVLRMVVALALLVLGSLLIIFTTVKIDLILNGLALVFLLELGTLVYHASVPGKRQKFIDNIDPVHFPITERKLKIRGRRVPAVQTFIDSIIPSLMFPLNFLLAALGRRYQVWVFSGYFRMTAAICLFAGPTVPFADKTMVSLVAGFCDSLLGVSCAPQVVPDASREKHGYCVITDQTTMSFPTVHFYLDDPTIFANRYNEDGSERSWTEWGEANPILYSSGLWMKGPYQDLLRKQCLQMYQKNIPPDDVMVDDDSGETMDGAPFMCAMEPIFDAVFGDVEKAVFSKPSASMNVKALRMFGAQFPDNGGTGLAAALVRSLDDPKVVAAVDACKHSKVWSPEQKVRDGSVVLQAVNSSSRLEDAVEAQAMSMLAATRQHRRLRRGRSRHTQLHAHDGRSD